VQSQWEKDFSSLGEAWSGREVKLELVALDRHGTSRDLEQPLVIGLEEIRPGYPERVQPRFLNRGSIEITPMILVRGNWDGEYRFRGRDDLMERGAFKDADVKWDDKIHSTSWGMIYEKKAIADYYLDETEVTRAQYRAFLQAEDGFSDAENWPSGTPEGTLADTGKRKQELLDEITGDDRLPITGVTWEEAHAYATWVGKSLPSYPQWEFAVRGKESRIYAAQPTPPAKPEARLPEHFNFGSGRAWQVGNEQDHDLSPEGIRNLDTNVMEWTSSPRFYGRAGAPSKADIDKHRLSFADSHGGGDLGGWKEFFAVGGHFRSPNAEYTKADLFRRDEKWSHVGFRCAQDASRVARHQERKTGGLPPDIDFKTVR
jgi:formylglycine-generating enzyme required for sulfatase activity